MTESEKQRIKELRDGGLGYKKIAALMHISVNTIKSHCRNHKIKKQIKPCCLECGVELLCSKTKPRKFCSDRCRKEWWQKNKSLIKRKKLIKVKCPSCGREFFAYEGEKRKFCSHECYIENRFGGKKNE